MSISSPTNSFKQLDEYLDNPFDTPNINESLNDFWKKIDNHPDDIDPEDGDHMPSE